GHGHERAAGKGCHCTHRTLSRGVRFRGGRTLARGAGTGERANWRQGAYCGSRWFPPESHEGGAEMTNPEGSSPAGLPSPEYPTGPLAKVIRVVFIAFS